MRLTANLQILTLNCDLRLFQSILTHQSPKHRSVQTPDCISSPSFILQMGEKNLYIQVTFSTCISIGSDQLKSSTVKKILLRHGRNISQLERNMLQETHFFPELLRLECVFIQGYGTLICLTNFKKS